jgi:hypothetical protein
MTEFFTDYLSTIDALSDADLCCLLIDAVDFDDDAAFEIVNAEMGRRGI